MIELPGISFGFGRRIGRVDLITNFDEAIPHTPSCGFAVLCAIADDGRKLKSLVTGLPPSSFVLLPSCSPYSHLAANLWSMQVPVLTVGSCLASLAGCIVSVDFDRGTLRGAESESEATALYNDFRAEADPVFGASIQPPSQAKSSSAIEVLAEVKSSAEFDAAIRDGADGVGVIRVEDLLDHNGTVDQAAKRFLDLIKSLPGCLPLNIRFFDLHPELNRNTQTLLPTSRYDGTRGVRLGLECPEILGHFLRVLDSLSLDSVCIILPMVAAATEVEEFIQRLGSRRVNVGITIETPAAALDIERVLDYGSYIQIGLNDLTQFTMACNRDTPNDRLLPHTRIPSPVATLIRGVVRACTRARRRYTVGLDLRPSHELAYQIRNLGVYCLSCPPRLVRPWKEAFASLPQER